MRDRIGLGIALTLGVLASLPVTAQEWPSRPLTMIVPFAAGGTADTIARVVAGGLSQALGQQVIIENVGGAGGMIGVKRVAHAPPDGYQFVLGSTGNFAQNQTLYRSPLYNAATDFAPVALVTQQDSVLVARKSLPADDLRGFISHVKANQSRIQFGSSGAGSAPHLACALFNAAIGVNVTHVPYRGGGPAMQDLIAGRIDYQCPINTAALPHIESGTIKAIAVLAHERSSSLPGVATAREQGLANVESPYWIAIFLPKATPEAIIRKLHGAIVTVMNTAVIREQLKKVGADLVSPERRSPQYLQRFVESEIERWAGPIRASGLTMD